MNTLFSKVLTTLKGSSEADLARISEGSGVPVPTLAKIKYGVTKNPGVLTVQAVADFLHAREFAPNPVGAQPSSPSSP